MIQVLSIVYVLIFFWALIYGLRFEWSAEGEDERGKAIANQSYSIVFPMLPIGLLAFEIIDEYFYTFTYEEYRLAIWLLLTGLYILHSVIILVSRRFQ